MFLVDNIVLSAYLIGAIIFFILIVFLFTFPFIHKLSEEKRFKKRCFKKVYSIVNYNDYYLINDLPLINDNEIVANVDHVIFSDKFMYVIKNEFYGDIIRASKNDNYWIGYDENGKKSEFRNPMILNEARCDWFSQIKHIDRSFFISIVLVNDSIQMKNIAELNSFNSFLCKKKDLKKVIKQIEKRDVQVFNPKSLEDQVKGIASDIGRRY